MFSDWVQIRKIWQLITYYYLSLSRGRGRKRGVKLDGDSDQDFVDEWGESSKPKEGAFAYEKPKPKNSKEVNVQIFGGVNMHIEKKAANFQRS